MEAVRKHLISHHTCLMEQLESEYMNYINQLLIRKSKLVIKMQEEFYKELNTLNTLCVQRHRQSNDIPRFTPTTFETDDIQNGSTSSTKHPSQINSTPIEFINDIVCDEEATQHTSPSIQSHAVHSDTLNDVDSDHSTIHESKSTNNKMDKQKNTKPQIEYAPTQTDVEQSDKSTDCESIYKPRSKSTNSKLDEQQKRSHKIKSCKCPYTTCDKVFHCQAQLKIHVRTHTGERPYKCSYADCNKAFKQKGTLTSHIRTHTGQRPYKCSYADCSKSFKAKTNLANHIRVHTGERPYKCNYTDCGKAFKQNGALTSHIRIHTGEKPYQCSYINCHKAFKTIGARTSHMRTHTGEKPYECNVCKKRFARSETRAVHLKGVHGIDKRKKS
eukprot:26462_1